MGNIRKTSGASKPRFRGKDKHQHWYRDSQVYFLVARCRGRFPAFASEDAKAIFWRQLEKYAAEYGFELWIASLLDNHYHVLGYLERGKDLAPLMQRVHGSVAKLVNDALEARRVVCPGPTFEVKRTIRRSKRDRVGVLKDPHPNAMKLRRKSAPRRAL